jgi:hypothetical protein
MSFCSGDGRENVSQTDALMTPLRTPQPISIQTRTQRLVSQDPRVVARFDDVGIARTHVAL